MTSAKHVMGDEEYGIIDISYESDGANIIYFIISNSIYLRYYH